MSSKRFIEFTHFYELGIYGRGSKKDAPNKLAPETGLWIVIFINLTTQSIIV
jgi:hypothetical protein